MGVHILSNGFIERLNCSKQTFLLDTNIIYWNFYQRTSQSQTDKKSIYQGFLKKIIGRNKVCVTTLNLLELAKVIECNELKIYRRLHGDIDLKDYRVIATEMEKVKQEIGLIYEQIKSFAIIEECGISKANIETLYESYNELCMDPNDYMLAEFCREKGYHMVTDDADFKKYINSIDVFSVNGKFSQ